ncbi:hypothetical protein [Psychroserpens sp. NJDZ02]|uniref:hypothetical protein n=1 Tax=Psychroserpens sp. NJDZ02 TaxID=2570561 RepID=UPI0010A7FC83|nr:hypothetical protein [Psychroserpens sp. NJDZ02]QCE43183.1 hypothetical protein E9099_17755 [Psychroserpens sp. NJDZ02]
MNGIRIVLLGVGILILIINLFINSGNLFKIVSYCFQTNSISQYWTLFFKSSVSGRAVISSILGFILALLIFIAITPFVLIRKSINGKKTSAILEEGLLFQYQDLNLENEDLHYTSNINQVTGLQLDHIKATGKIRIDAIILISEIDKLCKTHNKAFTYSVMEKIILNDKKEALAPIILTLDGKKMPTYFIFNETHKSQFSKIRNTLYNNGYKNCIYFSTIRM